MRLDKKAKAGGADRYIAPLSEDGFNVYVPQTISRVGGKEGEPVKRIVVTIVAEEEE